MQLLQFILVFMFADQPRQVLLFYNSEGKALMEKQTATLQSDKPGLTEREIVIKTYDASPKSAKEWKAWEVDPAKTFTFVLVGKDGGEKYRSDKLVPNRELFGLIDAMPMRQSEVKRN